MPKDMNDRTHCETCNHYVPQDERTPCFSPDGCKYDPIKGAEEIEKAVETAAKVPDPKPPKMAPVEPLTVNTRCHFRDEQDRCKSDAAPGTLYCPDHKGGKAAEKKAPKPKTPKKKTSKKGKKGKKKKRKKEKEKNFLTKSKFHSIMVAKEI